VKHEQRINRRTRQAAILREAIGAEERVARAGERNVERDIAFGDGLRRRVRDDLALAKIFEEIAGIGFGGHF